MPYGTLAVDTVQSSVANTPPQFQDGNGTQVGTLCRSWVNFNGLSGSVAIRASFNTSSVTRTATGFYTISFTNAMPDANYAVEATGSGDGAVTIVDTYTTTSYRMITIDYGGTYRDVTTGACAVFR